GSHNKTGTQAAPLNPMLAPLANNGGTTQTHALLPGSPAINAGSNVANLATDQRGFQRVAGGQVDIGAYESGAALVLPPKVMSVTVNDGSAQRSMVTKLVVTFSETVSLPTNAVDAFQLVRQSPAETVSLSVNVVANVVTLTFIGGPVNGASLADGRYTLTV